MNVADIATMIEALCCDGYIVLHDALSPSDEAWAAEAWAARASRASGEGKKPAECPQSPEVNFEDEPHISSRLNSIIRPEAASAVREILSAEGDQIISSAGWLVLPASCPKSPFYRGHSAWSFDKRWGITYLISIYVAIDNTFCGDISVIPSSNISNEDEHGSYDRSVSVALQPGSALVILGETLISLGNSGNTIPAKFISIDYHLDWMREITCIPRIANFQAGTKN